MTYLLPFSDLAYFISLQSGVAWQSFVAFMNIIIFIPSGILLRLLFSAKKTFIGIILSTVTFESFQLFTGIGCFATTDLILNALGGVIGMWLYHVVYPKMKQTTIDKIVKILCIPALPLALVAIVQTCYFIPTYL